MQGVEYRATRKGWPFLQLHYSAIPGRDEAWAEANRRAYPSRAKWNQEQENDWGAGGGERILREILEHNADKIIISDIDFKPNANWLYDAGFDYGKSSPTAFIVMARDHRGVHYAISEHYQSGIEWTPAVHADALRQMWLPCEGTPRTLEKIENVYADPSIFDLNQAQMTGEYSSIAELYSKHGIRMVKGRRGGDVGFVERLLEMWMKPEPELRIVCPMPYDRKREGTFNIGCPNLLWELFGLKRTELSATQLESRNPEEKLVQKNNHAFDALKYYFSSRPDAAQYSASERWAQESERYSGKNSGLDQVELINNLIWRRKEWEQQQEPPSYRWH